MLFSLFLGLTALTYADNAPLVMTSPEDYQIIAFSQNGNWACGVYNDYSYTNYGFRWNLQTGVIELLSSADPSEAWSISNDGVVAGLYTDYDYAENGAGVALPGYYSNGAWHRLELPDLSVKDGYAYSITPDGHYISGTICTGISQYLPYIWKDGKIDRALETTGISMPYAISPDGKAAAGWKQNKNRRAIYWKPDGTSVWLSESESPWCTGKKFTSDGKKILFWGGWDSSSTDPILRCVYDIETGNVGTVKALDAEGNFEIFDISDNETIVGEQSGRGIIYVNGQGQYVEDYLTSLGIDLSTLGIYVLEGTDYYQIFRAQNISADGTLLGLLYYDLDAAMRSMVIKLNINADEVKPLDLKAEQLNGIPAAKLTWYAPVGATGITGYNVYRDGVKLNTQPVTTTSYVDANLAYQTYSYTVSAIHTGGESSQSDAATVTIAENKVSAPYNLYARQMGYNNAYFQWQAPLSNLVNKCYVNMEEANIQGFGVSVSGLSFENAIRFSAEEVAAYAGHKLRSVAFYPMSAQSGWKVNLYTYDETGALKKLYTQNITQTLNYGTWNIVKLTTPQDLPQGELIVAIEVTASNATMNVTGMDFGHATEQWSDLLRQTSESDFYSISEMSATGGYLYRTQWLINAILAPADAPDNIDEVTSYGIYLDDNLISSTAATGTNIYNIDPEGTHTLGVNATYADGRTSEIVNTQVEIINNFDCLKGVDVVATTVSGTQVNATWEEPKDYDEKLISYSGDTPSSKGVQGPESNAFGLMAGVIYPSSMLKSYNDYCIESVNFYPLSDATFTIMIYKDNQQVVEQEIVDYTVGEWNTVKLDNPVNIEKGAQYMLVIDCYDVTPYSYAIAVDKQVAVTGYSDLYSLDGETWESIAQSGIYANWMMGLNIKSHTGVQLPVIGYDVNVDGIKRTDNRIEETSYVFNFPQTDTDAHTISVDTYYKEIEGVIVGAQNIFYLSGTGVQSPTAMADITLRQGDNRLTVVGEGVENVAIVSAAGSVVAQASGNTVNLNGLPTGVYVVKAIASGKAIQRKIRINR